MSDSAYLWSQRWKDRNPLSDFDSFLKALEIQFSPSNSSAEARDRLARLRQNTSVFNYSEEFWKIKEEIEDISEQELKYAFIRGLKKDLQIHIRIADQDQQLSFESVEKLASNIDAIQFGHQWGRERSDHMYNRRSSQHQSPVSPPLGGGYRGSGTGQAPMQGVTYGRLSLQEEERHRREKRCFSCHETGRHQKGCRSRFRLNNNNIGRHVSPGVEEDPKEKEE